MDCDACYHAAPLWFDPIPLRRFQNEVLFGTIGFIMRYQLVPCQPGRTKLTSASSTKTRRLVEPEIHQHILDAAFTVFTRHGYAQASTLEIASQAKISKRDLYACFGKKEDMLVACITDRAKRLKWPQGVPSPQTREAMATALEQFGYQLLCEVTDPTVISIFRLAICEAERAPEIPRILDSVGRQASRDALKDLFTHAKTAGLVHGDEIDMTRRFLALLWGDLMLGLLLRVAERPGEQALAQQARQAVDTFMRIFPPAEQKEETNTS